MTKNVGAETASRKSEKTKMMTNLLVVKIFSAFVGVRTNKVRQPQFFKSNVGELKKKLKKN